MITQELERELSRLRKIKSAVEKDINAAPQGALRISHSSKGIQYYHRKKPSDKNGTYIKAAEIDIARSLAQKEHAQSLIKAITPTVRHLSDIKEECEKLEQLLNRQKYSPERLELLKPYQLSDKEYVEQWLATPFESNPTFPEHKQFKTSKGEMVRSKSENIIAEHLIKLGIPYKYEAPLFYSGNRCIYPDFTILNVRKRQIIYLEHFGMMDSDEYRKNEFFDKLRKYRLAGLVLGDNLIATFEDKDNQIDLSMLDMLLKRCCM